MKIIEAVKRAIEEDDDSLWSAFVRGGCAIHAHEQITRPDRSDPDIMRRLGRHEPSARAGMTFTERADGTMAPFLRIAEERRIDPEQRFIVGGRRITDPMKETA